MSLSDPKALIDALAPSKTLSNNKEEFRRLSDAELWSKFKDGDESAFVQIYNAYFEDLCNFGVQYARLPVVEDCVQDMFVDLRRKRTKMPDIKHSIRLFLFQALKRRILNVLKKKRAVLSDDLSQHPFEVIPPHESLLIINQSQKDKLTRLDQALSGLNDKQREAVYYFFYKGMSYEEVQKMMGYDHVKSARNMIYKIIKSLKKVFVLIILCWPS
ncbi:RNA polymerase sigma factor [Echinicola sp. 20G]|uniref:RNA polymerase sigma factor n=1 Tax=Echinicola sp. 20G TaxID=2781961 RepID=UPI0019108483|nr:sigma-70 family RNA polymerase sigma factor [Echinicola sp. 20G]